MFTLRNMSRIKHPEKQYLELVNHIIKHGYKEKGRNGNVLTQIGSTMRFQLYDEDRNDKPIMPLMTTKRLAWKRHWPKSFSKQSRFQVRLWQAFK